MSRNSGISWTNHTWNCIRGCSRVSEGCRYCYAETLAARFSDPGQPFHGVASKDPSRWTGAVNIVPKKLDEPLKWKDSALVFVNSMSDLFHDSLSDDEIVLIFEVMRLANWHIHQVLTKRADRMAAMLEGVLKPYASLPHIWFGVSVENRHQGLPRMETLKGTPARMKWLSVEPLLDDLGPVDLTGIDWVVTGGESGKHLLDRVLCAERGLVERQNGLWVPRPDRLDWVRSIRDQCVAQKVAYYHKQHGGVKPTSAGRMLDGRTWDDYPDFKFGPVPSRAQRQDRLKFVRETLLGDVNKVTAAAAAVTTNTSKGEEVARA